MTPTDDLKDFVLPSLTSPKGWKAATAAWRDTPHWRTRYPLMPYSSLQNQDEHLLQTLESFADATGRIGSALESLAKMLPDPGDLDSRAKQFVEHEEKITIGYQDAYRSLHRVAQAFEAFDFALEEDRRHCPDKVLAALDALGEEIPSVRSGFAKLDLTERSGGLIPLELSSRLDTMTLPAPRKPIALAATLTPAQRGRAASEPQRRPGAPPRSDNSPSPVSVSTPNRSKSPAR